MGIVDRLVSIYGLRALHAIDKYRKDPVSAQIKTFDHLLDGGCDSAFGQDHNFDDIDSFSDFQKKVPIRTYNQLQPYIDRLRKGEDYVLWNKKTSWFAKSSGTSSDKSKFIPVTRESLYHCHYSGFQQMIFTYLDRHPKSKIFSGKFMTLGGSVEMESMSSNKNAYNGDLSAILLKNSPRIAELARTPGRQTALIQSFEEKVEKICKECSSQNVTTFSGVPSWNFKMIQHLLEYNNVKYLTDIWPNLELFMHGGISFEPYRAQYEEIIPSDNMHYIENYNASEGYFAFQDDENDPSMLLSLNNGVFYEFIPLAYLDDVLSGRSSLVYTIDDVRPHEQYAMVISTNSGLWRYLIGDCVEFTSCFPHKIIITGRTQLYINAFGEELMIGNTEKALSQACAKCDLSVSEYSVAPIFMTSNSPGGHEWVVEFSTETCEKLGIKNARDGVEATTSISSDTPSDSCIALNSVVMSKGAYDKIREFADVLDKALCSINSDYEAKRASTINRLKMNVVPSGTFYKWMEARGKVGGQNKVPRLYKNRHFIEQLLK